MDDFTPDRLLELGDVPLDDPRALLERARTLVGRGLVRRMWLLLLDDERRQLPLLPQIDGFPVSPDAATPSALRTLLDRLGEHAAHVAIVLERPGGAEPEPDDLAWADAIARASRGASAAVVGVLLAHGRGVDLLR
jgi:hypothetical protein